MESRFVVRKRLNASEQLVLMMARSGKLADLSADRDPSGSDGDERGRSKPRIRAEFLFRACTGLLSNTYIHPLGIRLEGAEIQGDLNLRSADLIYPLCLYSCDLSKVDLQDAEARTLLFRGSTTDGISADRLTVNGSLFLDGNFRAMAVSLNGARISGQLVCRATGDGRPRVDQLTAQGISVDNELILRGIDVQDELVLTGAKVGGLLDLSNSHVGRCHVPDPSNDPHTAKDVAPVVAAQHLVVKGRTAFGPGFSARGVVDMRHSQLEGGVNFESARITPTIGSLALQLSSVKTSELNLNFDKGLMGGTGPDGR